MSGLYRHGQNFVQDRDPHERRKPEPRGGPAAGPREGEPGEEPGEVQEVLPEEGGKKSIRYEGIIFLIKKSTMSFPPQKMETIKIPH